MNRSGLITRLQAFLFAEEQVRVAWLGGSDATGRVDSRSDVDLVLVADREMVEATFGLVDRWLTELVGVRRHHRLSDPTAHGHPQALFMGAGLSDDLAVDLMVIHAETPVARRFLQVERHGRVVPLVDRLGWLEESVVIDREALEIEIDRHLESLAGMHPFQNSLVEKSMARGHWSEALDGYQRRMLRPLCDLMRIEHDPDRFDFGFRYLDRDLPDAERRRLERLAFVPDADGLRERVADCRVEIERRFDRIIGARDSSRKGSGRAWISDPE